MPRRSDDKPQTILDRLIIETAGDDPRLQEEAARIAKDKYGRVCLRTAQRHIWEKTNPALLATIDAANAFITQVGLHERVGELPHIREIYALTAKNQQSAQAIFNTAASLAKSGSDIAAAIRAALDRHALLHTMH